MPSDQKIISLLDILTLAGGDQDLDSFVAVWEEEGSCVQKSARRGPTDKCKHHGLDHRNLDQGGSRASPYQSCPVAQATPAAGRGICSSSPSNDR
jgi:hypothetical protein